MWQDGKISYSVKVSMAKLSTGSLQYILEQPSVSLTIFAMRGKCAYSLRIECEAQLRLNI